MNENNKRILIVDDDEALAKNFQSVLQMKGYFVEIALTGNQALKKAKDTKFDLAILDIKLRDMPGFEVTSKLREFDDYIGIILITGYLEFQDCIDLLELGIHEILLKPIAVSEIQRVVKEVLFDA